MHEVESDTAEKRCMRKELFDQYVVNGNGNAGKKIWNSIMMELDREMDG